MRWSSSLKLALLLIGIGACDGVDRQEQEGASLSPTVMDTVDDSVTPDTIRRNDVVAVPAESAPRQADERFPPAARRISSRADGAPPASLRLADASCVPGQCTCVGEFDEAWKLDDYGVSYESLAEGSTCVAADFDRDDDWDAVMPGGEGFYAAVMMEDGEPLEFITLDFGGFPRVVRTSLGPAILVEQGLDRFPLFEWRDGTFTRRYLDEAPR